MTLKFGNLSFLWDHLTGAAGYKNPVTQRDTGFVDLATTTAPLLNRALLTTNRTSGVRAVGDILTVTSPPGMDLANIQGVIDKGAGFVAIAGFVNVSTYTITASEVPPGGSFWPIKVIATVSAVNTDIIN